jgi:hypothetical protein
VDPKLKYCSDAIRAHPLPYDECSAPQPPWVSPGEGYRKLSLFADIALTLGSEPIDKLVGLGIIFRPAGKTATGFWGFGAQLETNFDHHWSALGRLQTSLDLQHYGKDRLTLAALGGLHHQDGGRGSAQLGMEAALEWRLIESLTVTLPFVSARYTFADATAKEAAQGPTWNLILGARLSLDLIPTAK